MFITHEFSGHSSKHGSRSGTVCLWQVLASIFAKFDVFFADPGYTLQTKQVLTIKPGCDENSAEHKRGCGEPVKDASGDNWCIAAVCVLWKQYGFE